VNYPANIMKAAQPSRHTGILLGRCNPYGAETGGPKRVLGGLYGPNSATTPGMDLPKSVEQGEWPCNRPAVVRCRMYCRCEHRGQVMELCSWHDEVTWQGEVNAGKLTRVQKTVRVHGHFEEIQKRQAASCPRCLYPPPYAELAREIQGWQAELSGWWQAGLWREPRAQELRTKVEDAGHAIDEAIKAGIVHNCPMTLRAIS